MTGNRTALLIAGFVAGMLLIGIPFWRLPYNAEMFVPGVYLGLAGLGLVTAALAFLRATSAGRLFWVMIAAFPTAVALRVIVEVAQDPTDHNLWPFELVFAAVFSLVAIVPGLLAGMLLRRLKAKG